MTRFVIMKRRGARVVPLLEAPIFDSLVEAENWAAIYLEGDPVLFDKSLESIEVHGNSPTAGKRKTVSDTH